MTVTNAQPVSSKMTHQEGGKLAFDVYWNVDTDDPNDGPLTVCSTPLLPTIYTPYSFGNDSFPYALLRTYAPELREPVISRKAWGVTLHYSNDFSGSSSQHKTHNSGSTFSGDPTTEPWKISGSYVKETKVEERDRLGVRITNSAHEKHVAVIPGGHDTLHLEGPSLTISLPTRAQVVFKTNSATIWGLIPRQLLMAQWTYEIRHFGNLQYVYHSLDFEINYDLWNEVYLDEGFREYMGEKNGLPLYHDILTGKPGVRPSQPVMLNTAGRRGSWVIQPSGYFLTKEVIKEYDFRTLGFPDPLPGPFV